MLHSPSAERRQHSRAAMRRDAKLYDPRARRYLPCATCDLSQGGALVELAAPWPAPVGSHLLLGLPHDRKAGAVVAHTDMMEVEVVRSLGTPQGRQAVAVRFIHAQDVAVVPALARAA